MDKGSFALAQDDKPSFTPNAKALAITKNTAIIPASQTKCKKVRLCCNPIPMSRL